MVTITVVDRSDERIVIDVATVDLALINSLRRTVIADVPNAALLHEPYAADGSQFTFAVNTCVLHDHMMAHRLSMVPLHFSRGEAQSYIPKSITVRLAAENKGSVPMDVTTEHCQVTLHDRPHPDTDRLFPVNSSSGDRPLLTVLKPGEKIDMTGTVVAGTAARHASFAVTSMCTFSPLLDDALVAAGREAAGKADDPGRALNRFEHIDRKRCWAPNKDGNPSAFRFTVESECGMTATDIIESAVDVLLTRCVTAKTTAPQTDAGDGMVTYELHGEGDTLGNLMQSAAVDDLCGDDGPLKFIGYYRPHPLQDRMLVRAYLRSGDAHQAFAAIKSAAVVRVTEFKKALLEALAGVA